MPTYDYICTDCKISFELFQSMTANPISNCPECGGNVKRLIGTGAGPIFKGNGFYQTDYKNTAPKSNDTGTNKQVLKKEVASKPETVAKKSPK